MKRYDLLTTKTDSYAHEAYSLSRRLPKHEIYGLTSQLRRASLSVPLNIIEGHARNSPRSNAQFLSIAYGSLKESQYVLEFAYSEGYITEKDLLFVTELGEEVARMLWSKLTTIKAQLPSLASSKS